VSTNPSLARLRELPKAEVHAHLEGCFEPGVLAQWAAQAGVPMPRPRDRLLQFEGLADFLHFLDWACGLAATRERLAALSYVYSRRLADSGGGYADVIVNPTHWAAWHGRRGGGDLALREPALRGRHACGARQDQCDRPPGQPPVLRRLGHRPPWLGDGGHWLFTSPFLPATASSFLASHLGACMAR